MSIWFVVVAVAALAIVFQYGVIVFQMQEIHELRKRLDVLPRCQWEYDDEFSDS